MVFGSGHVGRAFAGRGFAATGFAFSVLLGVAAMAAPRDALASCSVGTCSGGAGSYCDIQCGSGREYIAFGRYYDGASWRHGVCWWSFVSDDPGNANYWTKDTGSSCGCAGSTLDSKDWRIKAGSGGDLLRLASRSGETCSTVSITIDGDIDSGDDYMFWGEGDNDRLYLCGSTSTNPSSSYCISNDGRADGREGDDLVVGGTNGEDLWGSSGDDVIYGLEGDDEIWGGAGYDIIYGNEGSDTLHGDTECDLIEGDNGTGNIGGTSDVCWCEETDPGSGDTGQTWECETSNYCYGVCFGR